MTITEKLQKIAENEQKVYDAGYAKGEAAATERVTITLVNTVPASITAYNCEGEDEGVMPSVIAENTTAVFEVDKGSMLALECTDCTFTASETEEDGSIIDGGYVSLLHDSEMWNFIACYKSMTLLLWEI